MHNATWLMFFLEEMDVSTNSSDGGGNSPLVRSSRLNHLDKRKASIDKLERKRTEKLIKKKIIGKISDKKPDLASDLVNIKSRRVNFKWNLGNKIGRWCKVLVVSHYVTGDNWTRVIFEFKSK